MNFVRIFKNSKSELILKIRSKNFESFEPVSILWFFHHVQGPSTGILSCPKKKE
eukprot:Pgem_evm1s1797